jgi:hypothetical protein
LADGDAARALKLVGKRGAQAPAETGKPRFFGIAAHKGAAFLLCILNRGNRDKK